MKKHIDFYAAERQEELVRAGALDLYEEYWNARTVLRTNVYGALPQSVLNKQQEARLMHFGWRLAEVDFGAGEPASIDAQLCAKDSGYMVLKENKEGTEQFRVLNFSYMPLAWQ